MRYNLISSNTKLAKLSGIDYEIAGLMLPPHRVSGANLCPEAGHCAAVCLGWFSGRMVTRSVRFAAKRRAQLLVEDPAEFRALLDEDLRKFASRAIRLGLQPLFRPNVASDLDWRELAKRHPAIRFYDYTKIRSRLRDVKQGVWPSNYELTYSVSERSHNRTVGSYLRAGYNVSMVFDTEYVPAWNRWGDLPNHWRIDGQTWKVIDGDRHDIRLREVDGSGVVVGLRFKGPRKNMGVAIRKGFVQQAA